MIYEAIRRRALRYQSLGHKRLILPTEVFIALSGIPNPRIYPVAARIRTTGFCYHCKREIPTGQFVAICDDVKCVISFNRRASWEKDWHLGTAVYSAMRLYYLDLTKLPPPNLCTMMNQSLRYLIPSNYGKDGSDLPQQPQIKTIEESLPSTMQLPIPN